MTDAKTKLDDLAERHCEGWCKESGGRGKFNDCVGCDIAAAAPQPASDVPPDAVEHAATSIALLVDEWYRKPAVANPPAISADIIARRLKRFASRASPAQDGELHWVTGPHEKGFTGVHPVTGDVVRRVDKLPTPAPAERVAEPVEDAAKAVWGAMQWARDAASPGHVFPAWVEGGNSLAQDKARAVARRILSPVAADLSVQNPIEELRLAALDAFPDLACDVQFASFPEEGPYGETFYPDDGGRAVVTVAVGIPMEAVIEVMAHELAHVAAGIDAGHGPVWDAAFSKIHEAYCDRMSGTNPLANPAPAASPGQ
ncbi:hypothetical protein VQ042_11640 [Aurantimonas sp. A2-1-M11]|uniref:hypothetical protein n=1 Tax=Aurantimonas sp. A2-1-M11 TaxID=3113712 RepID=UPI002F956E7A